MAFHKININSTDFELAPKKVKSNAGSTIENKNCFIPYLSNGPGTVLLNSLNGEEDMAASTLLISNDPTDFRNETPRFFYNPSQNAVGATKFIGDLDGNATSATNASKVTLTQWSTAENNFYIPYASALNGNNSLYTDGSIYYCPKTNTLTSGKFSGPLDGLATAASNVRITDTEPTGSSTYYPTFVSGFASGTNYPVRANDGLQYLTREGSTTQEGTAILSVGNNIAQGTAGNKTGCLRIYGNSTGFGNITGPVSGGLTFYLPNIAGTFVTHETRGTAVGGTAKPVYIAANGRATACSSNVGSASRPVYMNTGTITNCTWGTAMTSGTNYYLIGATGSTAGLAYNTNVKVLTNAIYASSGFYESSDERLKDFQEDIEVNFSYLHNIPKKYYSWKDDATYTRHIGTSAQEVQKYYPELVNTDDDGYLTMNYDKLSVVALKAIDVLHEEVTELKKENAELKERLARLEELILNNR